MFLFYLKTRNSQLNNPNLITLHSRLLPLALIEMVTPQLASEGGWVFGVGPFGFAQGESVGVRGREEYEWIAGNSS